MTDAQRREAEKKLEDLQQQLQELRRALGQAGDGSRMRVEVLSPGEMGRAFKIAPQLTMMRRPKFGFNMSQFPDTAGAKVTAVTPGSPAEKAGLRSGDIVTLFNGVKLEGMDDPASEIMRQGENIEVGDTVTVEYRRAADRKRITMVAMELPGGYAYAFSDEPGGVTRIPGERMRMDMPEIFEIGKIPGGWLDVELVSVNKDLGEYFGTTEGVLVLRAPRDSSLGLKGGDVILSIGARKATSPSQAMRVMRSYEGGEAFEIQVLRQKKRVTVTAKVPSTDRGYFWGQN
ncbi:MAG: PDZ domain-containing protein [Gemmatimonadetes bacterium]|nr:PDZ domain-containing protein [Gemmatimonadota bacterium]